jgi:hypothetical protein
VQDAPAKLFADVFYRDFLAGRTFAEAVQAARREVYETHPHANTFGAYQCWGDPEYRLRPGGQMRRGQAETRFRTDPEWEVDAQNVRSRAKSADDDESRGLLRDLEELHRQFVIRFGAADDAGSVGALNTPAARALIAIGRAYGELGELKSAVCLIRGGLHSNASAASFEDLEQLANFEARHAVEIDAAEAKPLMEEDPQSLTRSSIERLKRILDSGFVTGSSSNSGEVLSITASAYRRQAMVSKNLVDIDESLELMYRFYGLAWLRRTESELENFGYTPAAFCAQANQSQISPDGYAFANFVLGAIVKAWYPRGGQLTNVNPGLADFVAGRLDECRARSRRALDFWSAVELPDCLLSLLLNRALKNKIGMAETNQALVNEIEGTYLNIERRFGSRRQWSSVYDQLLFVHIMLIKKPKRDADGLPRAEIRDLLNLVAPWADRRAR